MGSGKVFASLDLLALLSPPEDCKVCAKTGENPMNMKNNNSLYLTLQI